MNINEWNREDLPKSITPSGFFGTSAENIVELENFLTIEEQEKILKSVINKSKPFYERIVKIYVNFSLNNDRFKQRKKSINEYYCGNRIVAVRKTIPENLKTHKKWRTLNNGGIAFIVFILDSKKLINIKNVRNYLL